jgi:hypothetical protein
VTTYSCVIGLHILNIVDEGGRQPDSVAREYLTTYTQLHPTVETFPIPIETFLVSIEIFFISKEAINCYA